MLPEHVYATLVEVCHGYPWPVVQADEHLGEILNAVAYRHRDEGWGLSRKAGGRHVESLVGPIAEDILQLPNGDHFDVLEAAAVRKPLKPNRGGSIGIIDLRARPWVAPIEHRLSWSDPIGPGPVPGPVTPPPSTGVSDLAVIKAELAHLIEQSRVVLHALSENATKADVTAVKDELWNFLAEKVIAEQFGDLRKLIAESGGTKGPECRFPLRLRGSAGIMAALEELPDPPHG